MDRNFHTDDFERLLREKSNEFRMYPSKRIWHSIYNNIHPGRKWPSVAMSITLITSLLLTGYLNTKNTNLNPGYGKTTHEQKIGAQTNAPLFVSRKLTDFPTSSIKTSVIMPDRRAGAVSNNSLKSNLLIKEVTASLPVTMKHTNRQTTFTEDDTDSNNGISIINIEANKKETIFPLGAGLHSLTGIPYQQIEIITGDEQSGGTGYARKTAIKDFVETLHMNESPIRDINKQIAVIIQAGNSTVEKDNLEVIKKSIISTEDQDWIENYALYNRPASKKWANKLAWQLYVTPSVVYRTLYNDPNFGNTISPAPLANLANDQDINNAVIQKPSAGFEIGTGLQYSIFKGVKIKGALQLNFTRYNAYAFQNRHPVSTSLTMHDYKTNTTYDEYRSTPYSNKSGLEAVKLHNETFQVSLPIGADLKLVGNENLEWNFGVTIQPTYVAGGKSYLISSDRRYYVRETAMLNRWNLNAGFETFITFKANGLSFQLGPQFRTQLFSTNSKKFAVEERLRNYGLKFGIYKILK